jgi:tetratricopeptide (TPR) repeat protein
MKSAGIRNLILLAALWPGAPSWGAGFAAKDQELFNQGKVFMFEQKFDQARLAFLRLIREFPQSNLLPQAYYHSAYCLRLQKKPVEAVSAYEEFLQKYPSEPFLAAEARQAVADLAASLVAQGKSEYRARLVKALGDPEKEVRYFAALRVASLKDRDLNQKIVPILKEILAKETKAELVAPASIALLSIDPAALTKPEQPKPSRSAAGKSAAPIRMFHLRIYEGDEKSPPKVEVSFPFSFAQLAVMALDEPTKAEIRRKGVDIDNIWESLSRLGPTNILTIRSGKHIVKLWIQ